VSSVGPGEADVPLWIKIAYTLFVCVLVPVYVRHYGPANFLWFSDVALLVMVPALWIESRLVASMMALAVVLPELAWNLDFFGRLLTGRHLLGLSLHVRVRHVPPAPWAVALPRVPAGSAALDARPGGIRLTSFRGADRFR
jgi:hypothetical protein